MGSAKRPNPNHQYPDGMKHHQPYRYFLTPFKKRDRLPQRHRVTTDQCNLPKT